MLRLLLLRHAKSDWSEPGPDHDRPLAPRGKKAAPIMGRYIQAHNLTPSLMLVSSARRAQQTAKLAAAQMSPEPEIRTRESLYNFSSPHALLNVIRDSGGEHETLMLVGHNPTMETLADALLGTGNSAARAAMNQKFPTAALAVIEFNIATWHEAQTTGGALVSFVRPADIADTAL